MGINKIVIFNSIRGYHCISTIISHLTTTCHRMIDVVRVIRHAFPILQMTRVKGKDEAFKLIASSISTSIPDLIRWLHNLTDVWFTALFRVIRQWSIEIEAAYFIGEVLLHFINFSFPLFCLSFIFS